MRDQLLPLATTAMERSPSLAAHMQKQHHMMQNGTTQPVIAKSITNKIHNQDQIYIVQNIASLVVEHRLRKVDVLC